MNKNKEGGMIMIVFQSESSLQITNNFTISDLLINRPTAKSVQLDLLIYLLGNKLGLGIRP